MDVSHWLRSLGLTEYEAAFRDNKIDDEVLPTLTTEDLKETRRRGTRPPAQIIDRHRRTFRFAQRAGQGVADRRRRTPPADSNVLRSRWLNCDVRAARSRGYARGDPAYQDACSGAVARYDGFVAKFMGDGVLAYFGFPRAHEDDAERAARAGFDIVAAAAKLETAAKEKLRVRIGIATGLVVVGDLVGQGSAQEQAVVGDTPNLASRLQGLAEPGSLVIAESTRRLLGGTFELKALGPQVLKGFDRPVPVWGVLREAQNISRFEASRSHGHDAVRRARAGNRAAARSLARGPRGRRPCRVAVGRGRHWQIARSGGAAREIGDEPHVTMRYQCSPHHVNDAFYPITSQIWHAAGFVGGEPAAERLDKLEAMIAHSGLELQERRTLPRRAAFHSVPGTIPPARNSACRAEGAHDRGVDGPVRRVDEGRPGTRAARGRALDRPVFVRRVRAVDRPATQPARAARDHIPSRICRAVASTRACDFAVAQPIRTASGAGDDRARRARQGVASRSYRANRRQDRRRAAVRGGTDQDAARSWAFCARRARPMSWSRR